MFQSIVSELKRILNKSFVKNTLWELLAKIFTLAIQAAYFVILTRTLGAKNYGFFIGIASVASLVFPFSNLGTGDLLIQQVSRQKKAFSIYWGTGLVIVLLSSFILSIILVLASRLIFPQHLSYLVILMILLADLTCLSLFINSAKAFVSANLLKYSSSLQIIGSLNKLLATLILAFCFKSPTLLNWACLYLISGIITGIIGIVWASRMLGKPQLSIAQFKPMISQGVHFSIGESAYNINSNIDKTMLMNMKNAEVTGIYGAAYRFIEIGSIPIQAVLSASYPLFFQRGASAGIKGCITLAKKLLPIVAIYSPVALITYYLFAPWIPFILGTEFQEASEVLLWLAPIPIIGSLQLILADTLTGAGFQKTRSAIQVTTAAGNALLNLWLIPLYSWKGATWATLGSDSFRVICLLIAVIYFYYQNK
jgi:O-antigen/teichoic acid export membrane protein